MRDALWAITSCYNPMGYARRAANYRLFRRSLNVPLVTVESSWTRSPHNPRARWPIESGSRSGSHNVVEAASKLVVLGPAVANAHEPAIHAEPVAGTDPG